MSVMSEEKLIEEARRGNLEAWRLLYEANKEKIFALAYHLTCNVADAEDILQETFIKAFHRLPSFQTRSKTTFSSWIYRIAVNTAIDFCRQKKRREKMNSLYRKNFPSEFFWDNPEPDRDFALRELAEKIEYFINLLPLRQRITFVLKHYEQLTIKEIASLLGCTEGSIKQNLFRSLQFLRKNLKSLLSEAEDEMR
jgi:RNA polymerase sigma-70 factor (ECF subfamily)